MKTMKFLFILFLIPLVGFSQNYEEKVTQEVINGQEVTVVWTTAKKVVKAQSKPITATIKAVPNKTNAPENLSVSNNERENGKTPVKPMTKEEALAWILKVQGVDFLNPKVDR